MRYIIALTGPRQSGKTTLLKNLFPAYKYVSLENPDNREFARTDPNGFLKLYSEFVIIDEAQRVPVYENYSKRIVKTPKLYFYDIGLACYLLKITQLEQIYTHSLKGNLFENMMIAEYVKRINHDNELKDLWFWRDSSGHEIDLMIQDGENLDLLEFKPGQTIMPEMFKELNYFEKLSGIKNITKGIVYGGNKSHNRSDGKVLSWRDV